MSDATDARLIALSTNRCLASFAGRIEGRKKSSDSSRVSHTENSEEHGEKVWTVNKDSRLRRVRGMGGAILVMIA